MIFLVAMVLFLCVMQVDSYASCENDDTFCSNSSELQLSLFVSSPISGSNVSVTIILRNFDNEYVFTM